jgi:energy-coupling factor transport system ATP-binding protein
MAIKFEHVSFQYKSIDNKGYLALNEVNVAIENKGEFITLIGETGSGKSTLVQHMNALLTPTKGAMNIFGIKISSKSKENKNVKFNPIRKQVGLVFQFPEYQLFEETVEKDIMFGPKNFGVNEREAKKRAREAIAMVGLDESYLERSPFNLSGGEKKRVSIAGILAMEPDILILDEPTSGLDPRGRDALLKVFYDIHTSLNKTVLIITHDMNTVYEYARRVLVMREGELVYDGDPVKLFSRTNIDNWNLDVPDIIRLKQALETEFKLDLSGTIRNKQALLKRLEELLS